MSIIDKHLLKLKTMKSQFLEPTLNKDELNSLERIMRNNIFKYYISRESIPKLIAVTIFLIPFVSTAFSQGFWQQLSFPDSVSIQCITINAQEDIFIGVGDPAEAGGIYRSTDDAQSWEFVYDNNGFSVLAVDADENGWIYAGKNGPGRLLVSKDNGDSWEEIELPLPSVGNIVKIFCTGPDTIYISTWESDGSFLIYSFDSGDTWQHSYITDHPNEYVSDLDLSGSGELYVSVNGFFEGQGGVYRSDDGGISWSYVGLLDHQVLSLSINSANEVFTGDWWMLNSDVPGIHAKYEGQDTFTLVLDCFFVIDIVIDDEDHIYATSSETIFYSDDNGLSFQIIEDTLSKFKEYLILDDEHYLYASSSKSLVRSIDPVITGTRDQHLCNKSGQLMLFPNPAITEIHIELGSGNQRPGECIVTIYDLSGKLIKEIKKILAKDRIVLDVSHLEEGYYYLTIQENNKLYNAGFIKK